MWRGGLVGTLTERIDDAFGLLDDSVEPADPFPAIAHGPDAFHPMRALERREEEVPYDPNKVNHYFILRENAWVRT